MVSTRSSAKRKSIDDTPVEPQTLAASDSKRRRLPLRKKTSRAPREEIPDTDNNESLGDEGPVADETLDLDAALQAQVAAENPDTPVLPAAEARWQAAEVEEEDGDSDDEAPEAVSNVQAASRAKEAAEAMKRAAREEADKLRRKRKDRDARLKGQAQSRKAKEPSPQPIPASAPQDATAPEETSAGKTPIDKQLVGENPLPTKPRTTLLPDEFLASDSESEAEQPLQPAKRRKTSRKKATEPRDKRVGGTVYRVVKGVDARMAPKGEGRSRQVRAGLMKRGREGKGRNGGFVVGNRRVDWGTSRKC